LNGKYEEAVAALRAAISLRASSGEAYNELGLALSAEAHRQEAVEAFRKALLLDPENGAARANLDALKKTAPVETATSKFEGSSLLMGSAELRPRDADDLERIKTFEGSIEHEKFDELEPQLLTYLVAHPDSWRAHYIQGYVLFRQRKVGDSIRELAKSLELNVNNAEGHKILGKDFVIIGKYDYAQTELQQAVRLKPESAEIHYSLGEVYSTRDMFQAAKSEFTAAIQRDATFAEAYNALGFTDESLGDDPAALEAYQKAIRVADRKGIKFDAPYINLGAYYNRLNKPDVALQFAKKAIELNSKSDLAYYQVARAHQSRNEWDEAADALQSAISLNPTDAQYYYVLGQVYRKLGKQKESMAALETFQKLKREAELVDSQLRDARGASSSD
jgi:superkiller protein 3